MRFRESLCCWQSPFESVTVDPTGKEAPAAVDVQTTVAPATALPFESVTCATKGLGSVVPTIPGYCAIPAIIAVPLQPRGQQRWLKMQG